MFRINSFEEYKTEYAASVNDPEKFWAEKAEHFTWKKKWDKVLDWNFTEPNVKWFVGGKLNITENCLDRHLPAKANDTAFHWEPNNPNEAGRKITYRELYEDVCRLANVLKKHGVKKGDRVCIYMPMVPEAIVAMLATARLGAVHSVVFGGFSATSLAGRIQDCDCKVVLTSDGAFRGDKTIPMKATVDEALQSCPSVEKVLVLNRTGTNIHMQPGRDLWWHEEVNAADKDCPATETDSEDLLFILYTSGSTGKPKGVVHTCGGYMVYTQYSFENVFQYSSHPIPNPSPKGKGASFISSPREKGVIPGYFTTDPGMFHLLHDKAKSMRNSPTPAEAALWQSLRNHAAGYHFRRQHIIGQFIVDFVCLSKSLVVEVDGDIHDHQAEEDAARTDYLNSRGLEVIRFRNEEVLTNMDRVITQIKEKLASREHVHPKNTPPLEEPEGVPVYWCTADVGWVTGHSYITYAPLLAGATSVIFEGIPTYPDAGRFWQVVDKYKVNIFYTAPTAIRALEAMGLDFVKPYKLDSLKVLGSVGEPINEEAWQWYHKNIGKEKCPIVDTWWQTETGGILISPLANITKTKPSFATLPLPGVQPILVDEKGNEITGNGVEGNLCVKFPWPSIIRTTYGDHERCRQTYFASYKNLYFTGDGCKRDADGYYRITGRVDDVINVSGHRIGTAEVESAINMHPDVVESAVVGYPHEIKGQGIYAYVICTNKEKNVDVLRKEILAEVTKIIGAIAKPDKIQVVSGLPKTRSGKIMRRILRKVAEGDVSNLGDISTLLDPAVVEEIKKGAL